MAVSNSVDYVIRSGGSTTNGGGFKVGASGTDYSDQDAAQETYTTLAAASGGTTLTCSGADTFDSGIVGNLIYISGGTNFTVGWYEVTARASSTSVTIDRDPTNGSAASAGAGNMGGALHIDTMVTPSFMTDSDNVDLSLGSVRFWLKAGTHTLTTGTAVSMPNSSEVNKVELIGFNTTRGETLLGNARPLIDGNTNYWYYSVSGFHGANFRWTSAHAQGFRCNNLNKFINCSFVNTGSGYAIRNSDETDFIGCYFSSPSAYGCFNNFGRMHKCHFYDCNIGVDDGVATNCIFEDCGTGMVQASARAKATNCTFHNNTTGISATGGRNGAVDCVFTDNTTAISISGNALGSLWYPNVFHNNGTDISGAVSIPITSGTYSNKTGDPSYEDEPNSDFTISDSGAAWEHGARLPSGE